MNRVNHCTLGPKPEDEPSLSRELAKGYYLHMKKHWTDQKRKEFLAGKSEKDRAYWLAIAKEVNA